MSEIRRNLMKLNFGTTARTAVVLSNVQFSPSSNLLSASCHLMLNGAGFEQALFIDYVRNLANILDS